MNANDPLLMQPPPEQQQEHDEANKFCCLCAVFEICLVIYKILMF